MARTALVVADRLQPANRDRVGAWQPGRARQVAVGARHGLRAVRHRRGCRRSTGTADRRAVVDGNGASLLVYQYVFAPRCLSTRDRALQDGLLAVAGGMAAYLLTRLSRELR